MFILLNFFRQCRTLPTANKGWYALLFGSHIDLDGRRSVLTSNKTNKEIVVWTIWLWKILVSTTTKEMLRMDRDIF